MPRRNTTLTVEEILKGTRFGRTQSVGHMEVIPILDEGEAADDTFAPPNFSAGTTDYGSIRVQNLDDDRPTIVPTGSGFISKQYAQDHATPSAKFLKAGENTTIRRAMCIQETQGGLIRQEEDTMLVVLPAPIRAQALAMRNEDELGRAWSSIRQFNRSVGVHGRGDLVNFLKEYDKQLDEFVAEFELVPDQIGAIIVIGGKVVGVERAPNISFWEKIWIPLVRVCYGSLAIRAGNVLGSTPSPTRTALDVQEKSLTGIRQALRDARLKAEGLIEGAVNEVRSMPLLYAGRAEGNLAGAKLFTVANTRLAGQLVRRGDSTCYVSLGAPGA